MVGISIIVGMRTRMEQIYTSSSMRVSTEVETKFN